MKKIIAISVMLALVAGAVFADTTISGYVETRFSLAKQMANKAADGSTPDPVMGGSIGSAYLTLSGSNGDGTLGGTYRLRGHDVWRSSPWIYKAFVWWKPVEQVKVFLGIEQDGLFDTADFMGWGYHSGDNDYLFNHHWDFWRQIFPGNWDGFGLALSFYPMPGFDLNLVLPTGGINWPQATSAQVGATRPITNPDSDTHTGMIPGRIRFSGSYSLDFGKISFAYIGGAAVTEKGVQFGYATADNNGLIGASVLVTAVDGILIKVGGSAVLNGKNAADKTEMLISGGFGVAYSGDGFGVKARVGLVTQGEAKMFLTGSILPYFKVGEKGEVMIDIGVTNDGNKDPAMGWFVTPAYRLGIDGGNFKIGLQLFNNVDAGGNIQITGADYVKWNIPMLLAFVF